MSYQTEYEKRMQGLKECPTCGSKDAYNYGHNCFKNADGWHRANQRPLPTPELSTPQVDLIEAPFSAEQVNALNAFQLRGDFHSFTCGKHSGHRDLVATEKGWICEDCDYTQNWAHSFMVKMGAAAQPEACIGPPLCDGEPEHEAFCNDHSLLAQPEAGPRPEGNPIDLMAQEAMADGIYDKVPADWNSERDVPDGGTAEAASRLPSPSAGVGLPIAKHPVPGSIPPDWPGCEDNNTQASAPKISVYEEMLATLRQERDALRRGFVNIHSLIEHPDAECDPIVGIGMATSAVDRLLRRFAESQEGEKRAEARVQELEAGLRDIEALANKPEGVDFDDPLKQLEAIEAEAARLTQDGETK